MNVVHDLLQIVVSVFESGSGSRAVNPRHKCVQQLLAAFGLAGPKQTRQSEAQSASVEPLSDRELEVLQHIAEGLTNREIAERLYLSVYTVKAHARSIYDKLEANNRTQAVAKARELGILPRA